MNKSSVWTLFEQDVAHVEMISRVFKTFVVLQLLGQSIYFYRCCKSCKFKLNLQFTADFDLKFNKSRFAIFHSLFLPPSILSSKVIFLAECTSHIFILKRSPSLCIQFRNYFLLFPSLICVYFSRDISNEEEEEEEEIEDIYKAYGLQSMHIEENRNNKWNCNAHDEDATQSPADF